MKAEKTVKNAHEGSDFYEFLKEEGIADEVTLQSLKKTLALQIEETMKARKVSKNKLAQAMNTSRVAVDRILDHNNTSLTIKSIDKAARALGKKLEIKLIEA